MHENKYCLNQNGISKFKTLPPSRVRRGQIMLSPRQAANLVTATVSRTHAPQSTTKDTYEVSPNDSMYWLGFTVIDKLLIVLYHIQEADVHTQRCVLSLIR